MTVPASVAGNGGASAPFGAGSDGQNAQPAVVAKPPLKAIAIEEKGAEVEPVKVAVAPQEERGQKSEVRDQTS